MRNYDWFYLHKQVYVEFKPGQVLLYDTRNGEMMLVGGEKMRALLEEVCNPDNLGSVAVDEARCREEGIREPLQEIIRRKMGGLLEMEEGRGKPIALRPLLNLNKDFEKLADQPDADIYLKRDIAKFLMNLNVYLNGTCTQHCTDCGKYACQVDACTRQEGELPVEILESLLAQVAYLSLPAVHFLGGDIYRYSHLKALEQFDQRKEYHFHIHYANYRKDEYIDRQHLELMVTFPWEAALFREVWQEVKTLRVKVHFVVADGQEWEQAVQCVGDLQIADYEIHPFYTGDNASFFADNVFTELEDLRVHVPDIREIFRNQKINANFFGNLYVLPDGRVKANMNAAPLGHAGDKSLLDLVYQELCENTAWRRVRNGAPCRDCVYQYLCPPVSNYEWVWGRDNLCHIQ